MQYNYGQVYVFPVIHPEGANDNFIYLQCENSSGELVEVRLPRLMFQKTPGYSTPEMLGCRVKGTSADGTPILSHDIVQYVKEIYGAPEQQGEIYDFTVVVPSQDGNEYMSVIDRHGIIYRVKRPETPVRKGQRVKGHFYTAKNGYLNLTLVRESAHFPFFRFDEVCEALGMDAVERNYIDRLISTLPEMKAVRREIDGNYPEWPLTALRVMQNCMPRWFMQARTARGKQILTRTIDYMRALGLYLLEGSSFLNFLPDEHRLDMQQELTTLVEGVKPYNMTLRLVTDGRHGEFITSLLDRLQKSGFIYHPSRQFAVLMLVFRLFPEEVQTNLDRIFAVIFERKLSNWQLEPFRQAFIEQFDIYVKMTREDVDALPQVESPEERSRLGNLLTAIALELLIAGKDGMAEDHSSRLRSLFYRYASLVNPREADTLLGKSFLALMNSDNFPPAYTYENLKQPMVMLARAAMPLAEADPLRALEASHIFSNGYVRLTVDSEGLRLGRTGARDEDHSSIPADWMPWLNPGISLAGLDAPTRAAIRNLNDRAAWWASAEHALFERGSSDESSSAIQDRTVSEPVVGESVFVRLTGLKNTGAGNPVFTCCVVDEDYTPVSGTIRREDIVDFKTQSVDDRSWQTAGRGRIVRATVIEDNRDGTFRFSLKGIVQDFLRQNLIVGEMYTAGITNDKLFPRIGAVCSLGFGLYLSDPEHVNPRNGQTVAFEYLGLDSLGNHEGRILHLSSEGRFENAKTLTELLEAIEEFEPFENPAENISDEDDEIEIMRDSDEILSREDVLELAMLMRFKAVSAENLVQAFDYIHYARLLARLADDSDMAEDLATHASLLTMTQFFATNDRLDADALRKLRTRVENRPLLTNLYRRLEIVGLLGNVDATTRLGEIIKKPHNELEGNLARLALSYTFVNQTCHDDPAMADGIRKRIKSLLKVNYETPKSKYYGSESQFVEFKSSTIYKAVRQGVKSVPAADEQRFELLHIIAGFLNSTGGTLYVGVNDRGYASGLFEDMEMYRRGRQKIGKDWFTITDAASLALMLENLVQNSFGDTVSRKVRICVDDEAAALNKDVIQISVEPSYVPVLLEGKLFVRTSTSTRELRDANEREIFCRERELQNIEHEHALRKELEHTAVKAHTPVPTADEIAEPATESEPPSAAEPAETEELPPTTVVETSLWKELHLHDDSDLFVQPAYYLYFTADGKVDLSKTDIWRDTQTDCVLALPVLQDEALGGWLVVAFDNGRIMKFRLADLPDIRDIQRGVRITREDTKPVFAATVDAGGFLVCFGCEKSGTLMRRAVAVESFETSRMGGDTQPFSANVPEHVSAWEIVASGGADSISDCLPGRSQRSFGVTMRVRALSPEGEEAIKKYRNKLGPTF